MKKLIVLTAPLLVAACVSPDNYNAAPRTVAAAPRIEAPAVQPSAEVRDAQQKLRELGFYDRPVDGIWGPETRTAVERFQGYRGVAVTGALDGPTLNAIRTADAAMAVSLSDPTDVRTVQNRLRQLNLYNGAADGVWGSDTQVALESFQRTHGLRVGQLTPATVSALGLNPAAFRPGVASAASPTMSEPLQPNVVRGIQGRLRQLGFYRGAADGIWGPNTRNALADFQKSRGIEASGVLTPTTTTALGFDANNLSGSIAAAPRR